MCLRPVDDTISIMAVRPVRPPEDGAMSGRFLALSKVLSCPVPSAPRWSESVGPLFVEACSDIPPDFSDTSDCKHPLSYSPLPGPSVVFLKISERSPSRECVQGILRRLAPWSIESVPREDRKDILERAKEEAVAITEPVVRVVPVVLCGGAAFIQLRTFDAQIVDWLGRWWGTGVSPDPKVWDFSFSDPNSLLVSILEEQIRNDSGGVPRKDQEVTVESVSVSLGKAKMVGPVKKNHRAIDALLRIPSDSDPRIESIEFSVHIPNGTARLHVDDKGLWKADLPSCQGGFSRDRILRKFRDLGLATDLVKKELLDVRSRAES